MLVATISNTTAVSTSTITAKVTAASLVQLLLLHAFKNSTTSTTSTQYLIFVIYVL